MSLDKLKENLKNDLQIDVEETEFPIEVSSEGYKFSIDENGNIEEISGIMLSKHTLKLLKGESQTILATLTEGITGPITWTTSDEETVTVENGTVKAIKDSGTVTITAKVEGTSYTATCTVIIVQRVNQITAQNMTIPKRRTQPIEITTQPTGEVEELTYMSNNEAVAKVDQNGMVTGIGVGTATITITGKVSTNVSTTCVVTVGKERISVTAEEIAQNPQKYYGQEVVNYKANETDKNVYRIFYVDTPGEFGDSGIVYLMADWEGVQRGVLTSYTQNTLIRQMNPEWAKSRGNASWNPNEQIAAWLCDPTTQDSSSNRQWIGYFNPEMADYVIGAPSLEMYVKSYNQAYKGIPGTNIIGAKYKETNAPGYVYVMNGQETGFSTGADVLDYTRYNSMYCGWQGRKYVTRWLASPSSINTGYVCLMDGNTASFASNNGTYSYNPIVSIKPNVALEIEVE